MFARRLGGGRRERAARGQARLAPPAAAEQGGQRRGLAAWLGYGDHDRIAIAFGRMAGFDDDLRFAHVLADAADDITMRRFRALDLSVQSKPDLTPVTDADLATEEPLRNVLRRARPRDARLGEEVGRTGMSPRCWIIDPIDGTQNYVRGVPVWATLVGLMAEGEVTVGVGTAPALGRRWWAAQDGGAWTGRSLTKAAACRVSEVTRLEDASLSYSDLATWEQSGRLDAFLGLARSVSRTRAYGDFWSHVLVAEGAADISAEAEVSLWDVAALQVIVTEAGGTSAVRGRKPRPHRAHLLAPHP